MSVVQRLALAAVLIALMWGAVLWAMAGVRNQESGVRDQAAGVGVAMLRSRVLMPDT